METTRRGGRNFTPAKREKHTLQRLASPLELFSRTNPRLSRYHEIIHLPPPPPHPPQFCTSITSIAFNFSSVLQSFQEESENNTKAKF